MDFGQGQPVPGEGVGEVVVLAGVESLLEAIDLVLEPLLGGFILMLRELLDCSIASFSRSSAASSAPMVQPTANCATMAAMVSQCSALVTIP